MQHLKISDGDLLFVCHNREMGSTAQIELGKVINAWLKNKGLNNVEAYLTPHDGDLQFKILSVNDPFEEQVLK